MSNSLMDESNYLVSARADQVWLRKETCAWRRRQSLVGRQQWRTRGANGWSALEALAATAAAAGKRGAEGNLFLPGRYHCLLADQSQ